MRRWLNLFLAVAAGSVLLGCETAPVTRGGVLNRTPVRSIVSLSPSTSEVIASLNGGQLLVGRTASDDFPPTVMRVQVVASVKPDYEKIAELKPDLIAYDADLYSPSDIEKIKKLAGQTIEFKSRTIDDFALELYAVGALASGESAASTYVDKIKSARDNALADAPNPKPKAAMVLAGTGTEHMIAGTDSFYADMLRSTGTEVVGPKSAKYEPMSPESFVGWNPEIIVVGFSPDSKDVKISQARALAAASKILNDPRLKTVAAVKNRHIVAIDEALMVRRGYRVDKFIEEVRRRVQMIGTKAQ